MAPGAAIWAMNEASKLFDAHEIKTRAESVKQVRADLKPGSREFLQNAAREQEIRGTAASGVFEKAAQQEVIQKALERSAEMFEKVFGGGK